MIARAGTWGAVGWATTLVFQIALGAILFRTAGTAAFGVWSLLVVARTLLLLPSGGLASAIARDEARVGREPGAAQRRAASLLLTGIGAGVSLLVGVVFAPVPSAMFDAPSVRALTLATFLVGVEASLGFAGAGPTGLLRGQNRFGVLSFAQSAQAATGLAAAVVLIPSLGVAGAATASVLSRAIFLAIAGVAVRRDLMTRAVPTRVEVGAVLKFAAPLWLIAIGSQVGLSTDVPIVGAMFGATTAGYYAAGVAVPAAAASLLFAVIDVSFYRLSAGTGRGSEPFTRWLVVTSAVLAGLGFGLLAILSEDVLAVWIGSVDPLAVAVLITYSAVWAINAPVHALVLRAMSDGRHGVIPPVVLVEAASCVALSVALAVAIGPTGPAVATLLTIAFSNGVVVPRLLLGDEGAFGFAAFLRRSAGAMCLGAAMAMAIGLPLRMLNLPAVVTLACAGVPAVVIGVALLRRQGSLSHEFRRVAGLIRYGGWRLLLREREERRVVAGVLKEYRSQHIWTKGGAEPLVTVRIATYNRGQLVADRAIASASAQTYENLEILVVGDHCDPATEAAVRAVKDPRVRFENLPERGRYPSDPTKRWMVAGAAPMNRALDLARGDWIAPLDDDDEFTPDHIAALLDACRSGDLEFSYGVAQMEVDPGRWVEVGSWPLASGQIIHAAVLYSRALRVMRHEIDAWRIDEPGDWNLWRRMQRSGVRMGFVDQVVCRHYLEAREVRLPLNKG